MVELFSQMKDIRGESGENSDEDEIGKCFCLRQGEQKGGAISCE